MSKKCYRFFGGLLNTQEKWLNKMSEKGYRLVRTGKLLYEFEKCKPDEVTYCVEFIGEKSKESSIDYAKLNIENPIIRINTAFKGCSSLEKISVLPRIYHN